MRLPAGAPVHRIEARALRKRHANWSRRAVSRRIVGHETWFGCRSKMSQHPKATVDWALQGLEAAIRELGDGALARRVRSQFHQLLLAVEHETFGVGFRQTDGNGGGPSARTQGTDQTRHDAADAIEEG